MGVVGDAGPGLRGKSILDRLPRFQVTRQAAYSLERLLSLDQFDRSTLRHRIALVIFLTPLPALVIAILLELLPLQSPYNGEWTRDWAMWFRFLLTTIITTYAIMTVAHNKVPELVISRSKRFVIAVGVSVTYNACVFGVAHWLFPIPFLLVFGTIPCGVIGILIDRAVIGKNFAVASGRRPQFRWLFHVMSIKTVLMVVYPAYTALFVSVTSDWQNMLVPLLPLLKILVKNSVGRAAGHLADYLPVTIIFLVDVFNSLYTTVCMHNAGSLITALAFSSIEVIAAFSSLRKLSKRIGAAKELMALETKEQSDGTEARGFLRTLFHLCEHPERLDRTILSRVRVWACLPHILAPGDPEALRRLDALKIFQRGRGMPHASMADKGHTSRLSAVVHAPDRRATFTCDDSLNERLSSTERIKPNVVQQADEPYKVNPDAIETTCAKRSRLLVECLELLFLCEFIVVLRYVECFVPIVYLAHRAVVKHLSNHVFYPHVSNASVEQHSDVAIGVACAVQAIVLIAIHHMFRRALGFSPLTQLGYVLERHCSLVQSKLVLWILLLLQFSLAHFGGYPVAGSWSVLHFNSPTMCL